MSSSPIPTALTTRPPLAPDVVVDLWRYLAAVPDPRRRRGIRHSIGSVLVLAATAVAAGARSLTAIVEWAADLPQQVLAGLGARRDPATGRCRPPTESTLRRVLARADGDHLDAVISAWVRRLLRGPGATGPAVIAVDGKTLRGTVPRAGVHLLSALTHHAGTVVAQRLVPIGTSTNRLCRNPARERRGLGFATSLRWRRPYKVDVIGVRGSVRVWVSSVICSQFSPRRSEA